MDPQAEVQTLYLSLDHYNLATDTPYYSMEAQTIFYLCSKRKSYSHRQKEAAIVRTMRLRRLDPRPNSATEAKLGRHRQL
jgi:hypothetical protein